MPTARPLSLNLRDGNGQGEKEDSNNSGACESSRVGTKYPVAMLGYVPFCGGCPTEVHVDTWTVSMTQIAK